MSEFKLPLPRRLLRCETLRLDDTLVARDLQVFDELAAIPTALVEAPELLLVVDELVEEMLDAWLDESADQLTISLTMIEQADQRDERVAEVA